MVRSAARSSSMGPRRGALARLCVVSSACALLCAVPSHAAAPLAPHLAITVPKNGEVVIKLLGYDTDGGGLTATITTLPSAGALFQVTQIFSDYGYSPKRGVPIAAGAAVTGSSNQMIYTPPWNTNPPLGKWDWFQYTVSDGTSTSAPGIVWLIPPHMQVVASDFAVDADGWSVETNGARAAALPAGGLVYEAYSRGLLNHYIIATDAEIHVDRKSGDDLTLWRFVAPAKFLGNQAIAYGGSMVFSMGSAAGDFSLANINSAPRLVILDCATCDSNKGTRLVYYPDPAFLDGTTKTVSIPLSEASWLKDPKNTLLAWPVPSTCDMVEVLSGLTGVRILGDQSKWYESVAIDNVAFLQGTKGVPLACASIYY